MLWLSLKKFCAPQNKVSKKFLLFSKAGLPSFFQSRKKAKA
jgi:hypothetical protein